MGCGCEHDDCHHRHHRAHQISEAPRGNRIITVQTGSDYHMTRGIDQIDATSPTTTTVTLFGDAPIGTEVVVDAVGADTLVSGGELDIVDQNPTTRTVTVAKGKKRVFNLASTGRDTAPVWF